MAAVLIYEAEAKFGVQLDPVLLNGITITIGEPSARQLDIAFDAAAGTILTGSEQQ